LAGKTGTVNDHTDVWFIGYTPTFVTGVWMGNPLRKESLGSGMTGGHGAVPFFNAFMIPFMKDKERDTFPAAPPIPTEMKTKIDRNKREEQEKLEKANEAGRTTGTLFSTGTKIVTPTDGAVRTDSTDAAAPTDTKPADNPKPNTPRDDPKPKPIDNPKSQTEKPQGAARKGKKGGN